MQLCIRSRTQKTPLDDIALPVDIADHTALSKSPPSGKYCIDPFGGKLTQDQCPCSANRRVPGGIGAIFT